MLERAWVGTSDVRENHSEEENNKESSRWAEWNSEDDSDAAAFDESRPDPEPGARRLLTPLSEQAYLQELVIWQTLQIARAGGGRVGRV